MDKGGERLECSTDMAFNKKKGSSLRGAGITFAVSFEKLGFNKRPFGGLFYSSSPINREHLDITGCGPRGDAGKISTSN